MKNNNNNTTTTDIFVFSFSYDEEAAAAFLDDDVEDEETAINLPGDLSNREVQDTLERYSVEWRRKSSEYISTLKKAGLNVRPCFKKQVTYEKGSRRRIIRYFCNFYDVDLKDDIGSLVLYISKRPSTREYIRECICGFFN